MPLQQMFSVPGSHNSRSSRSLKAFGMSATATNHVDKVYTQDEKDTAGEHGPSLLKRCPSLASTCSTSAEICRICHSEADVDAPLICPCHCSGSLRFVHQKCLQRWIKSSQAKTCELCKYEFQMQSKTKPLNKWEKLDMSPVERRKILCSVTFHVIAITCVIWSLYVLIDRTTEEIARGELEWPFWTKLIVVAIGFTGGVVFMYVQCKMYIQLCRRWKTYNRVIFIQTCQRECQSVSCTPSAPDGVIVMEELDQPHHGLLDVPDGLEDSDCGGGAGPAAIPGGDAFSAAVARDSTTIVVERLPSDYPSNSPVKSDTTTSSLTSNLLVIRHQGV